MATQYLGRPMTAPIEHLDTIPAPGGAGKITMTCDEVTAHCPVTGQPDFYNVVIEYIPDALCVESKSLKLYLWHLRERRIFCEHLAAEIADTVMAQVQPHSCIVTVRQNVRGGISITAEANW